MLSRYQQLVQKATAIAFILGPTMFVLAASVKLSVAMGRESFVEGVLVGYGSILFVVIYLELAGKLGKEMPYLGFACAVFGLVGMTAGMVPAAARIWESVFIQHGVNESIWVLLRETPKLLALGALAPFGPLTSILLGIGFWRVSIYSRWTAVLLITAGFAFILAQAFQIGLLFFYPLATVAWMVALAPMGWRSLVDSPQ